MKRSGFIIFVLIIIYFIFLIRQDIIDNLELTRERQSVSKNVKQEETAAQELKTRWGNLHKNDYLERLARTRLGLVKKGETAYKVIGR